MERNYESMDWDELVDEIAIPETKDEDKNRQNIINVLITVGNECDCLSEVQNIFVKLMEYDEEDGTFPETSNYFLTKN